MTKRNGASHLYPDLRGLGGKDLFNFPGVKRKSGVRAQVMGHQLSCSTNVGMFGGMFGGLPFASLHPEARSAGRAGLQDAQGSQPLHIQN